MKNARRTVSFILLLILGLSLLSLGGCASGAEKRIKKDVAASGTLVASVSNAVSADYIEVTDMTVSSVKVVSESESEGNKLYECSVTVKNEYVSCRLSCTAVYALGVDGNETFSSVQPADISSWELTPLSAIRSDSITEINLPNNESIEYEEYSVTKVKFDKDTKTSTATVSLKANTDYVIAQGKVTIVFTFAAGKWTQTSLYRNKGFKMSWDIGGLWEGQVYKYSPDADWEHQYTFDIKAIDGNGVVTAVVYEHIYNDGQHQIKDYPASGKIEFETMMLTLTYRDTCVVEAQLEKDGFVGDVVNTTDNFKYYAGAFTRAAE